jgi:hypothetical protein
LEGTRRVLAVGTCTVMDSLRPGCRSVLLGRGGGTLHVLSLSTIEVQLDTEGTQLDSVKQSDIELLG